MIKDDSEDRKDSDATKDESPGAYNCNSCYSRSSTVNVKL
jgi:hypothetical protein